MSTMNKVHYINFEGNKPSYAMVMRRIGEVLEQGASAISVTWGENWIDLDFHANHGQWYGTGWIKDISGDDIAKELNDIRKEATKFIRDHFKFIHIK